MVRVAPIKMQVGPKVLWFDPEDIEVHEGDNVIVTTERGTEFGTATSDIIEVSDELIEQLKSPLKPVLRIANEQDIAQAFELAQKSEEALPVFKELAAQTNEDMHPVAVEFLFDGDKAVFYFEADERVDFRELVRRLAAHFHVRVDMRQIGVRDGARIIGGLGHCGQELCCKRLGGDFFPVSIRMAKEQNLSLNPQKISGVCGRLMCCLRYEYEAYKEVNARAPKLNAKVEIPDGQAKVIDINVPREIITLQLEDGQTFKIPLGEMQAEGEDKRPSKISQEAFEKYACTNKFEIVETVAMLETPEFSGEEKLADVQASRQRNKEQQASANQQRKPRRRTRRSRTAQDESKQAATPVQTTAKRPGQKSSGLHKNNVPTEGSSKSSRKERKERKDQPKRQERKAERGNSLRSRTRGGAQIKEKSHQASSDSMHRKSRRRTHKAGGSSDAAN